MKVLHFINDNCYNVIYWHIYTDMHSSICCLYLFWILNIWILILSQKLTKTFAIIWTSRQTKLGLSLVAPLNAVADFLDIISLLLPLDHFALPLHMRSANMSLILVSCSHLPFIAHAYRKALYDFLRYRCFSWGKGNNEEMTDCRVVGVVISFSP